MDKSDKSVMKSFSEKVFRKLDVYCQNQGEFFYTFPTAMPSLDMQVTYLFWQFVQNQKAEMFDTCDIQTSFGECFVVFLKT